MRLSCTHIKVLALFGPLWTYNKGAVFFSDHDKTSIILEGYQDRAQKIDDIQPHHDSEKKWRYFYHIKRFDDSHALSKDHYE